MVNLVIDTLPRGHGVGLVRVMVPTTASAAALMLTARPLSSSGNKVNQKRSFMPGAGRGLISGFEEAQTELLTSTELSGARPRDVEQMEALFGSGWPAFIAVDRLAEEYLPPERERFTRFELVVLDGEEPATAGWAVPIRWDGTREGLPAGYGDSLRRALEEEEEATTLVVCAAQVQPERTDIGLAGTLLAHSVTSAPLPATTM